MQDRTAVTAQGRATRLTPEWSGTRKLGSNQRRLAAPTSPGTPRESVSGRAGSIDMQPLGRFRGREGNLGLPRSVIMNMRNVLTIVYFVLTIYSFSGGLVHGVANYSSWKLISAEDF